MQALIALFTPFGRIGSRLYWTLTIALSLIAAGVTLLLGQDAPAQLVAAAVTLAPGPSFFVGCRFAQTQALQCGLWGPLQSVVLWAGFFWVGFSLAASRLHDARIARWRLALAYVVLFLLQMAATAGLTYASAAGFLSIEEFAIATVIALGLFWLGHLFIRVWPGLARPSGPKIVPID